MTLSVLSPKTLFYSKTRLQGTTPSGGRAPSIQDYEAAMKTPEDDNFVFENYSAVPQGSGSQVINSPIQSEFPLPSAPYLEGARSPSRNTQISQHTPTSLRTNSLGNRSLSEKAKSTPASYVRQSRVYSSQDFAFLDHHVKDSASSPRAIHNRIHSKLSPELSPIVNLLNAQNLRTYTTGFFQVPGVLSSGERAWFEVEAKLTGHELAFWRPAGDEFVVENGNDEFTPKYINLTDATVEVVSTSPFQIRILQDWQEQNTWLIQFHTAPEFYEWLAAIYLSKYEYISLNEAFTAVVLSTKAKNLSDIHVLLSSKKRFAHHEWCNLRLPQVSNKWLKVLVVVSPGEKKKLGRIEIYNSDKLSKKNLLVYITNVVGVFNVFPEHASMIDLNAIMKINGDIYINRAHEHLFTNKEDGFVRTASAPSLSSMPRSPSFFEGAPHLDPSDIKKNRVRSSSTSRTNSGSSISVGLDISVSQFVKKNAKLFAQTNFLYLMPISHPGVPAVETMIRNFIHIIDIFKLYGRPEHFVSDKTDQRSMLFGLPSLPHYQYLSIKESTALIGHYLEDSISEQWGEHHWIGAFKQYIHQLSNGEKIYTGEGDIRQLYDELDAETSPIENFGNSDLGLTGSPSGPSFTSPSLTSPSEPSLANGPAFAITSPGNSYPRGLEPYKSPTGSPTAFNRSPFLSQGGFNNSGSYVRTSSPFANSANVIANPFSNFDGFSDHLVSPPPESSSLSSDESPATAEVSTELTGQLGAPIQLAKKVVPRITKLSLGYREAV